MVASATNESSFAPYAPELNDIEVVWHDFKAFNLADKTFTDLDTLDAAIHGAVANLNTERNHNLLGSRKSLLSALTRSFRSRASTLALCLCIYFTKLWLVRRRLDRCTML